MFVWLNKLVIVKSDPRLFAKIIADDGEDVSVEFFRSVADREVQILGKGAIHHAALPLQTRVFLETLPGIWRVGRVVDRYPEEFGTFSYSIKFPNDEAIELHEDACFVRCLDRYADPSRILAAGCIETQYFADRRRSALRRLRDVRSAAQGLVGVVSAAVELVPHQIATVRRVTTDRIQRYLLADEVGLGKTIEAGLIIRQLLLDDPKVTAIALVPNSLVEQWKLELSLKCLVDEQSVTVVSHDDINGIDPEDVPTLLVVDEAHRLIYSGNSTSDHEGAIHLRKLAMRVPKLLLLSATPALGDEERLLALLNLLDPASYPLDDLEAFRRRVTDRQKIGRLLLTIQPGASSFVLRQQANRAIELFPSDPVVLEDAGRLIAGIDAQGDRDATTSSLKDHIANTYRIHQRLIRARRGDVERWTMRPRGPAWPTMTHVRLCFGASEYTQPVLDGLEAWRDSATRACTSERGLTSTLAARWLELVGATWQGGQELGLAVQGFASLFLGENDLLAQLREVADAWTSSDDRYDHIVGTLRDWQRDLGRDVLGRPKKIACFASSQDDARRLVEAIEKDIGRAQVISLIDLGPGTAAAVNRFASTAVSIAVCDAASEEGVNLQFVHGILHMDLPFKATRIEQRIGRLDRFGRRLDKVEHRVFLPSDEEVAPWHSWFRLLTNGFQVFNRSISDVQFRINGIEQQIALRLFMEGAYAVESLTAEIAVALTDERRQLDEQHALDGLAQLLDAGDELLRKIEASEEDESEFAADVEPWIRQVLGLRLESVGDAAAKTFELSWSKDVLVPEFPWRVALEPSLHKRWTWQRRQVLQPKSNGVQLLRPGSMIFEVLERLALWDDRGLAYATWRVEPRWLGTWLGFRLVWLVEPGLERTGAVYAQREGAELARRAEAFLPMISVEQYVDASGTIVTDDEQFGVLKRPYRQQKDERGRFDVNLGSRPDLLQQAIDHRDLVDVINRLTAKLRVNVVETDTVAAALLGARVACDRDVRKAQRSLEVRASIGETQPGLVERPLPAELEDLRSLRRSIEQPNVRLDEIGFFVIAACIPT